MTSIKDLKSDHKNARRRTDRSASLIAESLKRYGAARSIVIDEDGRILAGNGTVEGAKKAGIDKLRIIEAEGDELIAVRRAGLTEDQKVGLALADNRSSDLSEWDHDMLRQLSEEHDLTPWFEDDELLAEVLDTVEGNTDPDDVPEAPEEPVTKPGDIWILGDHRLLCGDSTDVLAVERLMDGQKADMVFTDPPYNVAYKGKTKDALTIENDELSDSDFRDFLISAFASAFALMGEGSPIYVCGPLEDGNFLGAFHQSGLKLQSILIWLKNSIVLGRKDYHYKHEPIIYGWKEGAAHKWFGDRDKSTVFACNKPPRNAEHPTMKPVELVEYYIQNSSKIKNNVLDLFGGSGSTLIACEKTGRHARLMELDPAYCDVIVKRWEQFTGKKAMLEEIKEAF